MKKNLLKSIPLVLAVVSLLACEPAYDRRVLAVRILTAQEDVAVRVKELASQKEVYFRVFRVKNFPDNTVEVKGLENGEYILSLEDAYDLAITNDTVITFKRKKTITMSL